MTWWWETIRAAWDRFDTWKQMFDKRLDDDRLSIWWTEERMPAVEDTGSIVATPEDLAEIGIADPVTRPGRRYVGKHRAVPNDPVRRPS